MNQKSKLSEMLIAFFICTTCITILQGVLGLLLYPEEKLGYDAFLTPPLCGAISVLLGVVTWSKKELSVKQVLFRRGIHLLLIESMVFGLNYLAGNIFPLKESLALALGIALVFVAVYVILWINDKKSAASFNQKLKEYQAAQLS
ncbi:MAG: DUF3021 family protein [Lachnospiraceae bacterium]|nr:DUF3021 family protein [Lachnospiraceae bacterium]